MLSDNHYTLKAKTLQISKKLYKQSTQMYLAFTLVFMGWSREVTFCKVARATVDCP